VWAKLPITYQSRSVPPSWRLSIIAGRCSVPVSSFSPTFLTRSKAASLLCSCLPTSSKSPKNQTAKSSACLAASLCCRHWIRGRRHCPTPHYCSLRIGGRSHDIYVKISNRLSIESTPWSREGSSSALRFEPSLIWCCWRVLGSRTWSRHFLGRSAPTSREVG